MSRMMTIFWTILFVNFGFVIMGDVGINPFPQTIAFLKPEGYISFQILTTFILTLGTYSVAGYFFKIQNTMQTVIVSTIGGLYFGSIATNAMGIGVLVSSFPMGATFWAIVVVVMIIMGIIGLSQFATGGWQGHE